MDYADDAYRLARRRLFDAIAALSTATSRMSEEPASAPHNLRDLSEFLAAGYVFAAEIASIQGFLRSREVIDPQLADSLAQGGSARRRTDDVGARGSIGPSDRTAETMRIWMGGEPVENSYHPAGRLARRLGRMVEVAGRSSSLGARLLRPSAA